MVAVKEVAKAVEDLVRVCNSATNDDNLLRELSQAAAEVTKTLNELLNHIKYVCEKIKNLMSRNIERIVLENLFCFDFRSSTREKARESVQESAVETILISTDRLLASSGDSTEMVRQARVLGQATAQLIQAIKVRILIPKIITTKLFLLYLVFKIFLFYK